MTQQLMVPAYQMLVDLAVAGTLSLTAVLSPMIFRCKLPMWLQVAMVSVGIILLCGVFYALIFGHWPFRG